MKPFKINRNSWHYRLNKSFLNESEHWMSRGWEPNHSNFCAYWRATMFRIISIIGLTAILVFLLAVLVVACVANPIAFVGTIVSLIFLIAIVVGIGTLLAKLDARKIERSKKEEKKEKEPSNPSLFVQWYLAKKAKICPMVEFDE